MKVIVRVTTCRTLTGFPVALVGVSKYRIFHSDGENGDLRDAVLLGASVTGEQAADPGIRRRRNVPLLLAGCVCGNGDGGGKEDADLILSFAANEVLVALEGCDVGKVADLSGASFENPTEGLRGLVNTGVSAFRNSVYASGGVIGVELHSSPLIFAESSELEPL